MRRGARLRITASRIATGNKPIVLAAMMLWACGSDESPSAPAPAADVVDAASVEPDATDQDAGSTICPSGHISGPDGECMAVGIQGCDAMFIDPDTGLCDPSLVECPPGEIPIFGGDDQGCRAIGIVDCHPEFLDAQTGRCDPAPDACPEGSMAIPTQGCVSLDPPGGCGAGAWGNIEELPGDVHLDVNYTGGDSDGSREKPWTLYAYASGKVQSGGRIVLAAGEYDEGMLVSKSISLVGRCSSMVTLSGVREGTFGPTVLEVKGDVEVVISDLTVSGMGLGLSVHSGAKLSLSRASLNDNHLAGILAFDSGTSLTASEVWVSGTQLDGEGAAGFGVEAQSGASVSLSRSCVSDNHSTGLNVSGSGTSLTASEVWVSGTQLSGEGKAGFGVVAQFGASLSLSRSRVSDNHSAGLAAFESGTSLTASEMWVSGTQVDGEGLRGYGVVAQSGASVNVSRSRVSDNHTAGLLAGGSGTSLTVTEAWVSGTQVNGEGEYGWGVSVQSGASVSLSRSCVSDNHSTGLNVSGSGTSLTASEVWVSGTPLDGEGLRGYGVVAQFGASLSLSRSLVSDNHTAGLAAFESGTSLTASEMWVSGTQVDGEGLRGYGVVAQFGANANVSRSLVSDNHTAAILFFSVGGSVTESLLEGTKPGGLQFGDGLLVTGSVVSVQSIISRDNARAGVLFDKSDGEVSGSLITQNAIGLANQGLPGATVADDNVIEGNDQERLDDGDLKVPDEAMSLPEF